MGWITVAVAIAVAIASPCLASSPETSCDLAAAKAEQDWNIPKGILSAVGTVESGRRGLGGTAPWPWTINVAGRGTFHESKGDAVATVLAIMIQGFPYIDVGCFQVDIAYHPGVFASLDEAFDPEHNAQAAARILLTERSRSPDWGTAVARYHSATPALGSAYLERVLNALPSARLRASLAQAEPIPTPAAPPENLRPDTAKLPIVIYARPITTKDTVPQPEASRPRGVATRAHINPDASRPTTLGSRIM